MSHPFNSGEKDGLVINTGMKTYGGQTAIPAGLGPFEKNGKIPAEQRQKVDQVTVNLITGSSFDAHSRGRRREKGCRLY
jgi:hypothetical protein